jgi:predicted N-acetyltransferase YhbS
VSPEHQGKGFGRELVAEGLERARNDPQGEVPVVVIAAEGKEFFYQKCGFGEIEGYTSTAGGDENPLFRLGIGGGAVLWKESAQPV